MALETVQDYVNEARVILQDKLNTPGGSTYRYSDDELVAGLNIALQSAHKLRRDLFLKFETTPQYVMSASTVEIDELYRRAVLYFMCGHAQLRDEEETTDARATAFLNAFAVELSGVV